MRSVAPRLTKTGDNHRMQSSTCYSLSLPPSLDLFLRLALFADWISAQFSLTLDLLSLQSPHRPLTHLKADTAGPVSFPLLLVFRVRHTFSTSGRRKKKARSSFGSSGGVEWCDRFTHLCHSDEHHGPCLPASPPGDGAAKRLWGIFIALPAKHLLPITQRGQL